MHATATTSAAIEAIFAALCRDLKPQSETEEQMLRLAAIAQHRLDRVSAAMLAELDAHGYTDLYFKLQRSEAKDRAALHASLNQYRQLESRRVRLIDRLKKKLDQALDRAVTPRASDSVNDGHGRPAPAAQGSPATPRPSPPAHRTASPGTPL